MKVARRHAMGKEGTHTTDNIKTFIRPYDGMWSKSMVGYGDEDAHFVVELTYNYGIKSYVKGNDFKVKATSPH